MNEPRIIMAWNTFQFCKGLRFMGSLMIVLVLIIVAVSYYAIVIANYGPRLLESGPSIAVALPILIAFHFLLGMLLWCYFSVVLTDPGSVPQFWRPVIDEEDVDAQTLPLSNMSSSAGTNMNLEVSMVNGTPQNPRVRYCRKCCSFKPPRCHHCSICSRCVLKMDHHCVWIAGCVGAQNYKSFLLFLLYTFLETTLVTLALLPPFIDFFKDIEHHSDSASRIATTFLGFVLNVAFALSLLGFIIMHTSLVLNNTTTIEVYEKKRTTRWKYDLGWRNNFEQVFGTRKMYWFIPVYDEEDLRNMPALQGLDYPVRPELEGQDL